MAENVEKEAESVESRTSASQEDDNTAINEPPQRRTRPIRAGELFYKYSN
jgi:hypothetical protein